MDYLKTLEDARTWVFGGGAAALAALWLKFRADKATAQQVNFDLIAKNLETQRARLSVENHECDELLAEAQKIIQHLNEAATHQGVKTFLLNRIRREAFEELDLALACMAQLPDGGGADWQRAESHIRRAVRGLKEDVIVPAGGQAE